MVIERENSNIATSELEKQQQYMQKMKTYLSEWEQNKAILY